MEGKKLKINVSKFGGKINKKNGTNSRFLWTVVKIYDIHVNILTFTLGIVIFFKTRCHEISFSLSCSLLIQAVV